MKVDHPFKLVILISGNGSNLQAVIDAVAERKLSASIAAVISDKADAYGLIRAEKARIPTCIVTKQNYATRSEYDLALQAKIEEYQPDLIVLAGFMRILMPEFVNYFKGKIINIHPSLLPKHRGMNTHARVLEAGEQEHGITVHLVTEELDAGPIIAQARLSVLPEDTAEILKHRIHQLEHQLYPLVIQWIAEGRLEFKPSGIFLDQQQLSIYGKTVVFT